MTHAQEYKIKLVRPQKTGDQYTTTVTATIKQSLKGSAHGQDLNNEQSYTADLQGTVKIETVDDKYSLPTRFTCKVDHLTKDGKDLYPTGTVIEAGFKSKRPVYTIDGKPVEAQNVELLSVVLPLQLAEAEAAQDKLMGTDQTQKVGATWPADSASLAKAMAAGGVPIPADAMKAQSTLTRVRKLNGTAIMEVTTTLNADNFKNTGPNGASVSDGAMDVETTVVVPVDETKPMISKTGKVHMHMTVTAPNNGGTLTIDSDRDVKETHEAIQP
jgi:hypothetical protein